MTNFQEITQLLSVLYGMEWEKRRQEQAQYYTDYTKELRGKFEAGYLSELTPYRQFLVYKTELIEGKWQNIPHTPRTHRLASPTDPATWGTLEDALAALQSGAYNGIGFTFSEQDPFVGIALNRCVHDNHRIDYRQDQFIRRIRSYAEYCARNSAHLLVKAKLPVTTRKHDNIEIFNSGHTMSLTLKHIPGTPLTIEDRQAELDALLQALSSPPAEKPTPSTRQPGKSIRSFRG